MHSKLRNWHKWVGGCSAFFIIVVAITGILLNHGSVLESTSQGNGKSRNKAPEYFDEKNATELINDASSALGEGPINELKVKKERDHIIWEIETESKVKLIIKNNIIRSKKTKRMKDIVEGFHTGQIVGDIGMYIIDIVAVAIVFLGMSGMYMWFKLVFAGPEK